MQHRVGTKRAFQLEPYGIWLGSGIQIESLHRLVRDKFAILKLLLDRVACSLQSDRQHSLVKVICGDEDADGGAILDDVAIDRGHDRRWGGGVFGLTRV